MMINIASVLVNTYRLDTCSLGAVPYARCCGSPPSDVAPLTCSTDLSISTIVPSSALVLATLYRSYSYYCRGYYCYFYSYYCCYYYYDDDDDDDCHYYHDCSCYQYYFHDDADDGIVMAKRRLTMMTTTISDPPAAPPS